MRIKTVIRYYCDHCSRGGFRKPDMANHETSCTLNPKRSCWLCTDASAGRNYAALAAQIKKRSDVSVHEDCNGDTMDCWGTSSKEAIGWLSSECGECPACILSVLRQGKIFAFEAFDYKECVASWHAEQNREFRDMVFHPIP